MLVLVVCSVICATIFITVVQQKDEINTDLFVMLISHTNTIIDALCDEYHKIGIIGLPVNVLVLQISRSA